MQSRWNWCIDRKVLVNNEIKIPFAGTQYLFLQEQRAPPGPMGSSCSLSVVPGGHVSNFCRQRFIQLATPPAIQMQCDEQSLVINEELTGWVSPSITQLVSPDYEKKGKKLEYFAGSNSKERNVDINYSSNNEAPMKVSDVTFWTCSLW